MMLVPRYSRQSSGCVRPLGLLSGSASRASAGFSGSASYRADCIQGLGLASPYFGSPPRSTVTFGTSNEDGGNETPLAALVSRYYPLPTSLPGPRAAAHASRCVTLFAGLVARRRGLDVLAGGCDWIRTNVGHWGHGGYSPAQSTALPHTLERCGLRRGLKRWSSKLAGAAWI